MEVGTVELLSGSPLHIPLDALDLDGDALTFTATSDNSKVTTYIPEDNPSMRISVRSADGAIDGDMILELFQDRVPRVTSRIIDFAQSGFYDGLPFHRVIDGFVIQAGNAPTGMPDFDDQFHADLQHNRAGVLSMAKQALYDEELATWTMIDDSNSSQFFILDTPAAGAGYPRHLDFDCSVFGQLIEGFDVLGEISGVSTDSQSKPTVDVLMESVQIFVDNENGVLMLKAPEDYTGTADVQVTVSDGHGGTDQITIHVNVVPDALDPNDYDDGGPYLLDVPEIRTTVNTPVTFTVSAVDVEGDWPYYFDQADLILADSLHRPVPLWTNQYLAYTVDQDTGEGVVTPSNNLVGIHGITVAALQYIDAIDYEVLPVFIVPNSPPTAQLDMTLVRDLTGVDVMGEISALPGNQWIDEWDEFTVEVWATVTQEGSFGVHTVSTDLTFDKNLFTATGIEYGPGFRENRSGQIDNAAGVVSDLGGTTGVFTIDGSPDFYDVEGQSYAGSPSDPVDVNLYGDHRPVLVARVHFAPNLQGPGIPLNATDGYIEPQTELGFAFANATVKWSSVDATALTVNALSGAELWPVMYDIDDDGEIGLGDLSFFAAAYRHTVGEAGVGYTWASDFDHDGEVALGDLSFFAAAYRQNETSPGRLTYPTNFPLAWRAPSEGAAPGSAILASPAGDVAELNEPSPNPAALDGTLRPSLSPRGSTAVEETGDEASAGQAEAAAGQFLSPVHRPQTVARRKADAVDLVMRFYDPMR